jgi:hypothetical protein
MSIYKQDFERFMNQARVKLTGASDAGIKAELFDVLHEFFNDSDSWLETLSVPIVTGTTTYALVPALGGLIIRLQAVYDPNNIPQPAFMPEFGTLSLVYPVNTSQPYTVIVSKQVLLPTSRDDVPDAPPWVMQVYERTILDGVLGKMMGQQNKSYSNDTLSTYHLKRFRDGIQMARVATQRQNTKGAQAWRFPQQYRVSTQRGGISTANPTTF